MRRAGGRILTSSGLVPGTVHIDEEGRVARVEEGQAPRTGEIELPGVVAPAPTNAHTHLGDRVARGEIDTDEVSIEEAVAPPDGAKHRILRSTPTNALIEGMRRALKEAYARGVHRVIDFREGGPEGARALREAAQGLPVDVTVLGRPSAAEVWEEEKGLLVDLVDGIGISGLEDQPLEFSRRQAAWAREHDKRLALHLSEARREDTEDALSLEPELLVHCTACNGEDIQQIAQAGVPVAACPRSNALFGNRPPLEELIEANVPVGFGTDNAMFHEPDVFAEAAYVADEWPSIDAETILAIACAFALADEPAPHVEPGARIVVVDDEGGLRAGLRDRRIQIPGRIER